MMKKKYWKTLALVLALVLIVGVFGFANSLVGNPLSKFLAERSAESHVAVNYPGTDYYVERVGFDFKSIGYYAHIRSQSSMDTQFTLRIDMWGRVKWDTYEDVLSGSVTARRLEQEYRELTDQVFEDPAFPYETDIAFGTLDINPREALEDPNVTDIPEWSLVYQDLILDHSYDPRELGAQAGRLVVYVYSGELTHEVAAEVLLNIRAEFDRANIPFRVIDFTLHYPRTEDGPWDEEYIGLENFPCDQITEEGLVERVAQADADLKAYRAMLDAEQEKYLATMPK